MIYFGGIIALCWLVAFMVALMVQSPLASLNLLGFWATSFITVRYYNGKHRRTDARDRRDSPVGTNSADAGADSAAASVPSVASPREGPMPRAGEGPRTIAGEIEAYRCWQVVGDYVLSFNNTLWTPGETMKGLGLTFDNTSGVYSFARLADAIREYGSSGGMVVVGKVKLWGTIIEHRNGYRAEYAKVSEFIQFGTGTTHYENNDAAQRHLDRLNALYVHGTAHDDPLSVAMANKDQKLDDLRTKHVADCASFHFRCERHGDFLRIYVTRGSEKIDRCINLMRSLTIHVIDGAMPDLSGQLSLTRSGRLVFPGDDYPRTKIIETAPEPEYPLLQPGACTSTVVMSSFVVAGGGFHHVHYHDPDPQVGYVAACPTAARDDIVHFEGARTQLFVPAELGQQVMATILSELDRNGITAPLPDHRVVAFQPSRSAGRQ